MEVGGGRPGRSRHVRPGTRLQDALASFQGLLLPSICVHNNTQELKTGKAWEHSSHECQVDARWT